MLVRAMALSLALAAPGCGVVYTSPYVAAIAPDSETAQALGISVEIVPVSYATILDANASVRPPARLPAAFDADVVARSFDLGAPPRAVSASPTQFALPDAPAPRPIRRPPAGEPEPYRMGVGDEVAIERPGTNQREVFAVQDNGALALPGAGQIAVSGLSLDEARNRVLQAFVDRGLTPDFSFEITGFNSQSVIVSGAVPSPTTVPLGLRALTLEQALQRAGGVAFEDLPRATVELSRGSETYTVPVREALQGGGAGRTILRDGDVVFVDIGLTEAQRRRAFDERIALGQLESSATRDRAEAFNIGADIARIQADRANTLQNTLLRRRELGADSQGHVYLAGEFQAPRRVPLPYEDAFSLADALYAEQGGQSAFSIATADMSNVYVLRRAAQDPRAVTAYRLDAANAAMLVLADQMLMRDGDIVFIAEQPITAWNRVLSQLFPQIGVAVFSETANAL